MIILKILTVNKDENKHEEKPVINNLDDTPIYSKRI